MSRGKGASNNVSSTNGTLKWRMLISIVPIMQMPVKTSSDTQMARQCVASSTGITAGVADLNRCHTARAMVNASRPRKPGSDFKTSNTGK